LEIIPPYNRTLALKRKLNTLLREWTEIERDYFGNLSINDLLKLKSALSDVNNILTLKATVVFVNWLTNFLKLSEFQKNMLIEGMNKIGPNSNGYDVKTDKVVAEVKCIIPINNGDYFGAAQRNSILDDALKLLNGKKELWDTSAYIKIIGLLDIGQKTDAAIRKLITEAKNIRTKAKLRLDRHDVVKKLRVLQEDFTPADLNHDCIYIKKIQWEGIE
jgi:hypothetical protein